MADDNSIRRGQLLWAHVPFISWLPYDLRPEERSSDREHDRVRFRLEAFKYTPHRLSQDAMDIIDQWLVWYLFDRPLDPESFLHMAREGLPDFVSE